MHPTVPEFLLHIAGIFTMATAKFQTCNFTRELPKTYPFLHPPFRCLPSALSHFSPLSWPNSGNFVQNLELVVADDVQTPLAIVANDVEPLIVIIVRSGAAPFAAHLVVVAVTVVVVVVEDRDHRCHSPSAPADPIKRSAPAHPGVLSKQPTQAPFIQASNITEGITDSEPTKFLTRDSKFSDCTFNWATSSIPTRGLETEISATHTAAPFYLDRNRAKTIHDINIIATSIVCKQRNGNITTLEPREPRQHARHVGYERRSRAAGGRDGDRQRRRGRRDWKANHWRARRRKTMKKKRRRGEEEDDDEDDESSDSENEDPARERSTESKPNSRTTPTASSITINGAESSTQVPVTKPESPPAVAPHSPLSSPPAIRPQAFLHPPAGHCAGPKRQRPPKSKATKPRKHRDTVAVTAPRSPAATPLRTVRLEITLRRAIELRVDVRNLAKATGQSEATPPHLRPPPESEDEEAARR
ncbi:hypothetical protein DFP72DRAFT_1174456 [Ephemerocybe angulata]|uniref:Uncharacterized protein n=1 Tax=Ephemerocybe angulata TaxID=980116 RepID=A0A8H6M0X9_9AGAR|nr:hypothetical protein DFP72DRAFT_1174456 [Tulosesus angulatus]